MQTDPDDDDDMALEASGDQAFDEDVENGRDGAAGAHTGEDIIHGDARRAIEALRESRQLRQELTDELDDFNFDESYGGY